MSVYLICCNMKYSSKRFKQIESVIRECAHEDTWMYYLENTWIIKSSLKADEIGTRINAITGSNDNFVVIEAVNNYACWLPQAGLDYLNTRIFAQ